MRPIRKIALVGCPNVGKSVLFNYLTGTYVTVSNYPGTTISLAKGIFRYQGKKFEIIDTPGMYALTPFTEEEQVTRDFLETSRPDIILHVVDAKNLDRMLPFTLRLIEEGFPVLLVVNLIDEAKKRGIYINENALSRHLGIPVVLTAATKKIGLEKLKYCIADYCCDNCQTGCESPVQDILKAAVRRMDADKGTMADLAGRIAREPLLGIPLLFFVLYFGIYQFVGRFGAGFLVDYLDRVIFAGYITPQVETWVQSYFALEWLQSLIIGDYGIYNMGVRYAVVIVLPIVGTFFFMFAFLEDCGYLPRLAMLAEGLFKHIGLNGRAVIPLTLGLGCGTMAVMVTKTLESRRERILSTFLLALAIPCSAQLGVVLALLAHNPIILLFWLLYISGVFLVAGSLAAGILPGARSPFYMELPPLRFPVVSNIVRKAYTRMLLYFTEILPVFVMTSLLLWLAERLHLLQRIVTEMTPLMHQLGLPEQTAGIFLLGFFRRDYGAAGLYDLTRQGALNDFQLLVAAITLTLFAPCIAQLMVMVKERGLLTALVIFLLTIIVALGSGILVNTLFSGIL